MLQQVLQAHGNYLRQLYIRLAGGSNQASDIIEQHRNAVMAALTQHYSDVLDFFLNSSESVSGSVDSVLECSRTSKYAPLLCSRSSSPNSDYEGLEKSLFKTDNSQGDK
jgi:hypothetical protein